MDPTPVRQPKKKGKVESGVRYVKRNGLAGMAGADVDTTRAHLARWVESIANQRIHRTTQRRPAEVFATSRIHGRSLSGAGCGRRPRGTDRQGFTSACPSPMAQLQNRDSKLNACR